MPDIGKIIYVTENYIMKKYYLLCAVLLTCLFYSNANIAQEISYKPGNGLHVSQPGVWDFLFSGYINTIFTYHNTHQNYSVQNSFYVHRGRLDLGFDYGKDYEAFFEFDAAPARTAMVLAQVQVRLFDKNYLLAGKFINPFSPENNRSTSRLTTVERYSGLNSIFLLPGLDSQYGVMFFGSSSGLHYYFSITNGNGEANQNIPENNNNKAITCRLDFDISKEFTLGASFDYAEEKLQNLDLLDHTFESFNTVRINGKRIGYLGHFEYIHDSFLLRGEAFHYSMRDNLTLLNQVDGFTGGYLELGYFLSGNSENGVQLIGRYETARYGNLYAGLNGPSSLNSYLLGTNWLMNNVFSFQVNLIFESADKPSASPPSRLSGKSSETLLLSTLQLRF